MGILKQYDAWQFVVNTNKNIKIARYCYVIIHVDQN